MTVKNAKQPVVCLFIYSDCASWSAKLAGGKPGLRSKQERITTSVDQSTVWNALGGEASQYQTKARHTSEHQGSLQHFSLPPRQFAVKGKHVVARSNKSSCCTVVLAIDRRPALIRFHPSRGDMGEGRGLNYTQFSFVTREDTNTADSLFCARRLMTICDALIKFLSDEYLHAPVSVVFALQMRLHRLSCIP